MSRRKTVSRLYEGVFAEAQRLMFEEGLSKSEAFMIAVPGHFSDIAEADKRVPSDFALMVWKAVNELQDGPPERDRITNGQVCTKLQLKVDAYAFKVWQSFCELEAFGMLHRFNGKAWSRNEKEDKVKKIRSSVAASD